MNNLSFSLLISLIVCIVIIIMMSIGIIRLKDFSYKYSNFRVNKTLISDMYDKLKTGDLILFTYSGFNPSNAVLSHTFYTHIGILIKKGDIIYVSETNPKLEYMPNLNKKIEESKIEPPKLSKDELFTNNGADLIPLLIRIKYYTGEYFIMQLSKKLDAKREQMLIKAAETLYIESYPYPSPLQVIVSYFGIKVDARHCWQHVAYLLTLINLLPTKYSNLNVLNICKKISELSGVKLSDKYHYKKVKQILYNL